MGLFDVFKKKDSKPADAPLSKPNPDSARVMGNAYEISFSFLGQENCKKLADCFKESIYSGINEYEISQKTELLIGGLDMCLGLLERANQAPQTTLGRNTLATFIYCRIFFDCVLALDTDIIHVTEWYTIFQATHIIDPDMHPYVQMMIRIYDLLDRGIEYLYKNMDAVTEDYFIPVEKRIRKLLNAYVDDNTGWNKINPQTLK